jgi:hypothetical protein
MRATRKSWLLGLLVLEARSLNCGWKSERELRRGARCIVEMEGPATYVYDPHNTDDEPKAFKFDSSYWSHDGFTVREDGYLEPQRGAEYTDQVSCNPLCTRHNDYCIAGYPSTL